MNILISLCFVQVLRKHSLQRGEGVGSALVVRLLVPEAGLGLWAAGDRPHFTQKVHFSTLF